MGTGPKSPGEVAFSSSSQGGTAPRDGTGERQACRDSGSAAGGEDFARPDGEVLLLLFLLLLLLILLLLLLSPPSSSDPVKIC